MAQSIAILQNNASPPICQSVKYCVRNLCRASGFHPLLYRLDCIILLNCYKTRQICIPVMNGPFILSVCEKQYFQTKKQKNVYAFSCARLFCFIASTPQRIQSKKKAPSALWFNLNTVVRLPLTTYLQLYTLLIVCQQIFDFQS